MQCAKCKTENSDTVTYCVRCHTPLKYTCPSCKNVQLHGGQCEKCGLDFGKYAAMLVFQAKETAQQNRKALWYPGWWVEVITFPVPIVVRLIQRLRIRAKKRKT